MLNSEINTDNGSESKPRPQKPSEYMRSTRPELFSDSVQTSVASLERSQLEYHLETLTSRKEEFVFEDFCRKLAEVEICPNLKPQTGPVGGGDSKTDASTYPIAELLIERCYWGSPNLPARESWAFAFSCKKQWRQKVRDDVAKIAGVKKAFSVVYFITNQYAKDKSREEMENELTEKHGFAVHILDRTWILDVVFSHKRENLTSEALGIGESRRQVQRTGPRDTERRAELDELLVRLRDPFSYYANDYSIAADYLQAAKLARGLECPRHEVTGLFEQARSVSKRNGYPPQVVRCAYEHAWADNWWHDDVTTAIEVYAQVEPLLDELHDASDLEMFVNLQNLLWQAAARGEISADEHRLRERNDCLRAKLSKLSEDKLRPNNALHTATMLAFMDINPLSGKVGEGVLPRLADCFKRSRGHATYPLRRFTDSVIGISKFIESMAGYDELFDTIRTVLSEREGDIAEARLLVQRGEQHLLADRPERALQLLGHARIKAAKEEILEFSVQAALLAAYSYLRMGLVWAARMEALIAAQLSCQNVDGVLQSAFYGSQATRLLAWIDLTQGRLAPFLRWMEIATFCLHRLDDDDFDTERFKGSYQTIETALCDRLIALEEADAIAIAPFAGFLHDFGFPMARWSLLYSANRGNEIAEEFTAAFEEDVEWMHNFFKQWKSRFEGPGRLVGSINNWKDQTVTFSTRIMGVTYTIECCRDFGVIAFSENLLGVIESMLALADWSRLAFIVDTVRIRVDTNANGQNQPDPSITATSEGNIMTLTWPLTVATEIALADRQEFAQYLFRLGMAVLLQATIDPIEDLKNELSGWRTNGTLNRALGSSPTIHAVTDLIGKEGYDLDAHLRAAALET